MEYQRADRVGDLILEVIAELLRKDIRDPRVRAVLILYTAQATGGEPRPGDDAVELSWFPLEALPDDIAFASHRQALAELRERLAGDASALRGR